MNDPYGALSLPGLPTLNSPRPCLSNPSGVPPPSGDVTNRGQHFTMLHVEDFNTTTNIGDWNEGVIPAPYTGWFTVLGSGFHDSVGTPYHPEEVLSTRNSCLDWYIHTASSQPKVAWIRPRWFQNFNGITYGRRSMRWRCDSVMAGYKFVGLFWPNSENWPTDGEIDFPECGLGDVMNGYMHHQNGVDGSDQDAYEPGGAGTLSTGWHTCTVEWLSSRCTFYLDGVQVFESTTRIPSTNMYLTMQAEVAGGTPGAGVAGHIQVDWVALWNAV